jgi:hypothetical protein
MPTEFVDPGFSLSMLVNAITFTMWSFFIVRAGIGVAMCIFIIWECAGAFRKTPPPGKTMPVS